MQSIPLEDNEHVRKAAGWTVPEDMVMRGGKLKWQPGHRAPLRSMSKSVGFVE